MVLPPAFAGDAGRLGRFDQEARAAAALNHPNILAVQDIGVDDGAPYVVSELLEGQTLQEAIGIESPRHRATRRGRDRLACVGREVLGQHRRRLRDSGGDLTKHQLLSIAREPFLDSLRRDAEYEALMQQVKLRWQAFSA